MRCCDGLHRVTSRPVGGSWQFPLPRPNGAHATRVPCWGSVLQSLDNSASRLHRRVCLACHIAALTYRPRFGVSRIHLLAAKNAPHPAQSSQLGCEMADPLRDAVCCLLVSDDTLVNPLKMRGKIRALSIIVWRELERTANLAVSPSGFSHMAMSLFLNKDTSRSHIQAAGVFPPSPADMRRGMPLILPSRTGIILSNVTTLAPYSDCNARITGAAPSPACMWRG